MSADTCPRCGARLSGSWQGQHVTAQLHVWATVPDGTATRAGAAEAVTVCSWGCLAVVAAQLAAREQGAEAAVLVVAERERQRTAEGFSPEHDTGMPAGELAQAGATYAMRHAEGMMERLADPLGLPDGLVALRPVVTGHPPGLWPWGAEWWKPRGLRRDLVRAAALIAAEVDRDAATPTDPDSTPF